MRPLFDLRSLLPRPAQHPKEPERSPGRNAVRPGTSEPLFEPAASAPPEATPAAIPGKRLSRAEVLKPPFDVHQPFDAADAAKEAAALQAALEGVDNQWSPIRQVTPSCRVELAAGIRDAAERLCPSSASPEERQQFVDELFVRAYAAILSAHAAMTPEAQRFLQRVKGPRERGLLLHGYLQYLCVPDGKDEATFKDLQAALKYIQGRELAVVRLAHWLAQRLGELLASPLAQKLHLPDKSPALDRLADAFAGRVDLLLGSALGQKLGLADMGLQFSRIILPPFLEEDGQDGGYSQISTRVDPRRGGEAEYVAFMKAANRRGIEVISDRVVNHRSYLHPHTQALLHGDLAYLKEFVNWSGAAKVDEIESDGGPSNVIVHAGEAPGAVSLAAKIFPDSNPDNVVRINVPLHPEWTADDFARLKQVVGNAFALDEIAQAEVKALYAEHGLPQPDAQGRRFYPEEVQRRLVAIREANNARTLARLGAELEAGQTPTLPLDLFMTFMGNIQFDKNLRDPDVLQEELDALVSALSKDQSIRLDAVVQGDKEPGTTLNDRPGVAAFADLLGLTMRQMDPHVSIIPEAFKPEAEVARDWLDPHLDVPGPQGPVPFTKRGNLAIAFYDAMSISHALLRGDASVFADYIRSWPKETLGEMLGYAERLHDEVLLLQQDLAWLERTGRARDPWQANAEGLAALEAKLKAGLLSAPTAIDEGLDLMRETLQSGVWSSFAGRSLGNDPSAILDSPEQIAQAVALSCVGQPMPAEYYRLVLGAGDNVDYALSLMKLRLERQLENGEPLSFRKAWDGRDLGRGPIHESLWVKRLRERYLPLEVTRAMNRLWRYNPTVRSRDVRALESADPAVLTLARPDPRLAQGGRARGNRGLLQVFNVGTEPATVRVPKEGLRSTLGWSDFTHARYKDVLASQIQGRTIRVPVRDAGDHLELTLPARGQVFLEQGASPQALARLARLLPHGSDIAPTAASAPGAA